MWGLGRGAPRKFSKNQHWKCKFSFGFSNVWRVTPVAKQSSVCNSGAKFFFYPWRGGTFTHVPPLATPLIIDQGLVDHIVPSHSSHHSSRADTSSRRTSNHIGCHDGRRAGGWFSMSAWSGKLSFPTDLNGQQFLLLPSGEDEEVQYD